VAEPAAVIQPPIVELTKAFEQTGASLPGTDHPDVHTWRWPELRLSKIEPCALTIGRQKGRNLTTKKQTGRRPWWFCRTWSRTTVGGPMLRLGFVTEIDAEH